MASQLGEEQRESERSTQRVHRGRDEIGGAYLPSQLQLTLQISLAKPANLNIFTTSTSEILFFFLFILPPEQY